MFHGISFLTVAVFCSALWAVQFVQKPAVTKNAQGKAVIAFSVSASTDVEVGILDQDGKVIRHLAAGVLGGANPPPAPLAAGLSQTLEWDGKDDYGKFPSVDSFKVRVRLGVSPQYEKRFHVKDSSMIPPSLVKAWYPGAVNGYYWTGWGPDTVSNTAAVINVNSPILQMGKAGSTTGVGLWDGWYSMIDLCVSKETDDIIYKRGTGQTSSPVMLSLNGITGVKRRAWTATTADFGRGEPVMDWFGRFYLYDGKGTTSDRDLYRFNLNGNPMLYASGKNTVDMPAYIYNNVHQGGFCNDQNGNIFQVHYSRPLGATDVIGSCRNPLHISKYDSVGALLNDSVILSYVSVQGIQVDLQGNLFVGVKIKPLADTVPKAVRGLISGAFSAHTPYSQAAVADEAYASIIKFGPEGGAIALSPTGPYFITSYFTHRLAVTGAKWVHYGASFIFTKIPQNKMNMCHCYNPRFDVDRFGRVLYPDPFANAFGALDNNGNEMWRVHNSDLASGLRVGSIVNVQSTDKRLYLGDNINNQIIVMTWKADAETLLSVPKGAFTEEAAKASLELAKLENTPNPFNPTTTIQISGLVSSLLKRGTLHIYTVKGDRVADLTAKLRQGKTAIEWNATDRTGTRVPSGVYFCRLAVEGKVLKKSITLIK